MDYLLIKNGLIHTGENNESPTKMDIVVRGDKIVEVTENISSKFFKKTATILDANNLLITPGFIEINESITSPSSILKEKSGMFYIKQGITSVIFGADGVSPIPLYHGSILFLKRLLSSTQKPINVSWQNAKDLYLTLENFSSINFGFLLGYSTLRSIFSYKRSGDLTLGEIENLSRIIKENLKNGALGLAFNLSDNQNENIPFNEISKIINFSGISKKIIAFNLEFTEDIHNFLGKIVSSINKDALNIELSNLYIFNDNEENYTAFINKLDEISSNYNINFDIFPEKTSKIKIHQFFTKNFTENKNNINTFDGNPPHWIYKNGINILNSIPLEQIYIYSMPKPLNFLEGKNLKDFMEKNKINSLEIALLKIAKLSKFQGEISVPFIQENILNAFINHPKSILTLCGGDYKNVQKILFEKILSSGKLVHKLTELPAKKLGILNRGVIKEGNYADLVIFKDNLPYYVFVNGHLILKEGEFINNQNFSCGMALKTKFEF